VIQPTTFRPGPNQKRSLLATALAPAAIKISAITKVTNSGRTFVRSQISELLRVVVDSPSLIPRQFSRFDVGPASQAGLNAASSGMSQQA
jgi:hypothetical protein